MEHTLKTYGGRATADDTDVAWETLVRGSPFLEPAPTFPECDHDGAGTWTEPRRRRYANGVDHYVIQCLRCGKQVRGLSAQETALRAEACQNAWFDLELLDRVRAQRTAAWDAWNQRRDAHYTYRAAERANHRQRYYQSDRWWRKRSQRFELDHYLCQARLPGCTTRAEQAHHLTYDHFGNEPMFDLMSVCIACHDRITAMDNARKRAQGDINGD